MGFPYQEIAGFRIFGFKVYGIIEVAPTRSTKISWPSRDEYFESGFGGITSVGCTSLVQHHCVASAVQTVELVGK